MKILATSTFVFVVACCFSSAFAQLPVENIIKKAFEDSVRDLVLKQQGNNGFEQSGRAIGMEDKEPARTHTTSYEVANTGTTGIDLYNGHEGGNYQELNNGENQGLSERSSNDGNDIENDSHYGRNTMVIPNHNRYDSVAAILKDVEASYPSKTIMAAHPRHNDVNEEFKAINRNTPEGNKSDPVADQIPRNYPQEPVRPIYSKSSDLRRRVKRRIVHKHKFHKKVTRLFKRHTVRAKSNYKHKMSEHPGDNITKGIFNAQNIKNQMGHNHSPTDGSNLYSSKLPIVIELDPQAASQELKDPYADLNAFVDGRNSLGSMNNVELKDVEEEEHQPSSIVHRLFSSNNIKNLTPPESVNSAIKGKLESDDDDDNDDEYNGHGVDEKEYMKEDSEEDLGQPKSTKRFHSAVQKSDSSDSNDISDSSDDEDSEDDEKVDNQKKINRIVDKTTQNDRLRDNTADQMEMFVNKIVKNKRNNDIDEDSIVLKPRRKKYRAVSRRHRIRASKQRKSIKAYNRGQEPEYIPGLGHRISKPGHRAIPIGSDILNEGNDIEPYKIYTNTTLVDEDDDSLIKPIDMINYLKTQTNKKRRRYRRYRFVKRHVKGNRIRQKLRTSRQSQYNTSTDDIMKGFYRILKNSSGFKK